MWPWCNIKAVKTKLRLSEMMRQCKSNSPKMLQTKNRGKVRQSKFLCPKILLMYIICSTHHCPFARWSKGPLPSGSKMSFPRTHSFTAAPFFWPLWQDKRVVSKATGNVHTIDDGKGSELSRRWTITCTIEDSGMHCSILLYWIICASKQRKVPAAQGSAIWQRGVQ